MSERNAIVLLSGGLDSATTLAIARKEGFTPYALSFRYGQRHAHELHCAQKQAELQQVTQHHIIDIDLRVFGHSALTSDTIDVPKHDSAEDIGSAIPMTYVPARNTIFLSYALAYAEVTGAFDIFLGVNAVDYSGYPDCRPEFIAAYEHMANLALAACIENHKKMTLHTPLINLSKADIIREGLALGVDYTHTSSCYDPSPEGTACGHCDSCLLRLKGFKENQTTDPVTYVAS